MTPPPTSPIATLAVERAAGHAGLALVTGASGYLGGLLVPRLLEQGWRVRVLTRRRARLAGASWGDWVEILEGDAGGDGLDLALAGVDVAYYLVHSMEGGDFVRRDRELARTFAAATPGEVGRRCGEGGRPEGREGKAPGPEEQRAPACVEQEIAGQAPPVCRRRVVAPGSLQVGESRRRREGQGGVEAAPHERKGPRRRLPRRRVEGAVPG